MPLVPVVQGLPLWLLPLPSPPIRRESTQAFDPSEAAVLVPLLQGTGELLLQAEGDTSHSYSPARRVCETASTQQQQEQHKEQQRWKLRPAAVALGLFAAVYAHAAAASETPYLLLQPSPYSRKAPAEFFSRLFTEHPELPQLLHTAELQQEGGQLEDMEAWAVRQTSRFISKADLQ